MTRRHVRLSRQRFTFRRKYVLIGAGGLTCCILIAQLLYPSNLLLPWQQIDGRKVGMQQKSEVTRRLDTEYARSTASLYFGATKKPHYTPKLEDFGLTVSNARRLDRSAYPWYLRVVPTSILWAHSIVKVPAPEYYQDVKKLDTYLKGKFGESCVVAPINATAKISGDTIAVVKEEPGGTCEYATVKKALRDIQPELQQATQVRIAIKPIAAKLTSDKVKPVVDTMTTQLARPLQLLYDDTTEPIDAKTIRSWLTFTSTDERFDVGFDMAKASAYLQGKLGKVLERPAGVSKVATHDFVEISRIDGQTGRKLDTDKTLANLKEFLLARVDSIPVGEAITPPQVHYTRSYSNTDTGLSALMKNYAESHPGVYGVSLVELDGKRRRAAFNDTQKFTTASTYKLYVAYSVLKRVESGEYKWSDQISGGRNLEKCFDDMIVKSDNACAEAFVAKISYRALTADAQTIVSGSTTFLDAESYKTTAGDLTTFMASLATGQIALNSDSQARFLGALKRNIYRQGIPAGTSGVVADKVGFLDGLLHDAAIVYSPSGTYVLSIMTDKSSWAAIAELTKAIEELRNQ